MSIRYHISYVTSNIASFDPVKDLYSEAINSDVLRINGLQELYQNILSPKFNTNLIILDWENLSEETNNFYDVITTIKTLNHSSNLLYVNRDIFPLISSTVIFSMGCGVIREILGTDIIGLIPKGDDFTNSEKLLALETIMSNECHIPQKIKKLLFDHKRNKKRNDPILTTREYQVVQLITKYGDSNKIIARKLNISESAVKMHVSNAIKKTHVKNRTQLTLI